MTDISRTTRDLPSIHPNIQVSAILAHNVLTLLKADVVDISDYGGKNFFRHFGSFSNESFREHLSRGCKSVCQALFEISRFDVDYSTYDCICYALDNDCDFSRVPNTFYSDLIFEVSELIMRAEGYDSAAVYDVFINNRHPLGSEFKYHHKFTKIPCGGVLDIIDDLFFYIKDNHSSIENHFTKSFFGIN